MLGAAKSDTVFPRKYGCSIGEVSPRIKKNTLVTHQRGSCKSPQARIREIISLDERLLMGASSVFNLPAMTRHRLDGERTR